MQIKVDTNTKKGNISYFLVPDQKMAKILYMNNSDKNLVVSD